MKTIRDSKRSTIAAVAVLSFACLTTLAQEYRVLHVFAGGANDGATPYGSLIQSGSTLYGMTHDGGRANLGVVFRMNTDGTGFQLLHSFVSGSSDGQWPIGSLILCDTTLYGMAASAFSSYGGTLFQMNTNGAGFRVLRQFSVSDGMWPSGALLQSGSVLYGLNTYGGSANGLNGKGTVFRIDTNGTRFQVLRTFAGGTNDGWGPHGALIQYGTSLYATTLIGGSSNLGTVFKINPDDTDFQILHHFIGGTNDGSRPFNTGALAQPGSTFFGMTENGGSSNMGTIFRMNADGTGFGLLHSFVGGANGQKPFGSLVLSGSMLYGVTSDEDTGTDGTIFGINTNGTAFRVLHRFNGADGRDPWGSLLLSGSTLYGMTSQGGSNNLGVIFALDLLPKLAISPSDTNVNLSWSTNFPGFALESVTQLGGTWTPAPGVTGYSATLPLNPETNQFFRLRK